MSLPTGFVCTVGTCGDASCPSFKGNKNIVESPILFLFPLFDGERRPDFKFVPFVFLSIWLICGSVTVMFSLWIVMLGESGNT